jgi:FkbM family methyltransferase
MYYGQPWKTARMNRFYAQFVGPDDLCFDVGAHVGNRVRSWVRLGARVVAVEPQPQMRDVLSRLYGQHSTVTIAPVGVADQPGMLTLHINTRNPTLTTFSQEWVDGFTSNPDLAAAPWDDAVEVEVRTLDQLIEEHGIPTFCKVDVEGFEDKVLAGLSQPITALSFEAFPLDVDRSIRCVKRLAELGEYRFRTVEAEQFEWVEPDWLNTAEIVERLRSWSSSEGSGDVYAQLG